MPSILEDDPTYACQDESSCSLCASLLGKRRLNPRHHCRICSRVVCGTCCPNTIQDDTPDALLKTQRVCVQCGSEAWRVPAVLRRLGSLSEVLHSLVDDTGKICSPSVFASSTNLEDVVASCEASLGPLEKLRHEHNATREVLAKSFAKTQIAQEMCSDLCKRLSTLCGEASLLDDSGMDGVGIRRLNGGDVRMMQMVSDGDEWMSRISSFEDCMLSSRNACERLEAVVGRERKVHAELAAEAVNAKDACISLGGSLHALCGANLPAAANSDGSTLTQAVALCQSTLPPLTVLRSRLESTQKSLHNLACLNQDLQTKISAADYADIKNNSSPAEESCLVLGPFRPDLGKLEDDVLVCVDGLAPLQPWQSPPELPPTTPEKRGAGGQLLSERRITKSSRTHPRDVASGDQNGGCAICGSLLGKRRFRPRHHCRICERLVCGSCSPSSVVFEGRRGLFRACTPCAIVAQTAPATINRLDSLAENLQKLGGYECGTQTSASPRHRMEVALATCEAASNQLLTSR